jgi:hypothetical protein
MRTTNYKLSKIREYGLHGQFSTDTLFELSRPWAMSDVSFTTEGDIFSGVLIGKFRPPKVNIGFGISPSLRMRPGNNSHTSLVLLDRD